MPTLNYRYIKDIF